MTEVQTVNNGNVNGTVPASIAGKSAVKTRSRRNLPALPSMAGASGMGNVDYSCKVDSSPTSWESLPLYSAFSLNTDGSYPMVKVSCSKACDLRTNKSIPVGSGRCFKVIF